MKNITSYRIIALLGVVSVSFWATSCLKDNYTDFGKVGTVVEFLDATAGASTALSFSSNAPDTVVLRLNATGPFAPTSDITMTVGKGTNGIPLYNLDTSHVPGTAIPDSSFSILTTTVTIKAGMDALGNANRGATCTIVIYPAKIPPTPGVNYVLDIGILTTSTGTIISGNFGDIMYNFYHNPYDGDYTSIGTRYNFNQASDYTGWDPVANAPLPSSAVASTGPWNFPHAPIATVNASTSAAHAGNSNGGFGTINLVVDPATNFVTIVSTPATLLNALVPLQGTGAPQSYWNPATKTFYLWYQYTNTTGTFRVLYDKEVHN